MRMFTLLLVDEILLPMYMNWSINFKSRQIMNRNVETVQMDYFSKIPGAMSKKSVSPFCDRTMVFIGL